MLMSELGFDTDWVNPSLPSAKNFDLPFQVMISTGYGATTFSRHATAEEAWEEASKQNDAASEGQTYHACDQQFNLLADGHFRKEEERFENMTDGLKV
jgi:hypothetical protein